MLVFINEGVVFPFRGLSLPVNRESGCDMTAAARKPQFVVLKRGDEEVKRWRLSNTVEEEKPQPVFQGKPTIDDSGIPVALGHRTLVPATLEVLIPPAIRKARDTAYAAAIEVGHPIWIARNAADLAGEERASGRPTALALLMARTLADELGEGSTLGLAKAAAAKAAELVTVGYSPGAAIAGGKCYAMLLTMGFSETPAAVGAIAAAESCEDAAINDLDIQSDLQRGRLLPTVLAAAKAAALAAATSYFAASVAAESAGKPFHAPAAAQAAAAAGAAASRSIRQGQSPEAAKAAGQAASRAIEDGLSENAASFAGSAAGSAIMEGFSPRAAAAAGTAAAVAITEYEFEEFGPTAARVAGKASRQAIADGFDEVAAATAGQAASHAIAEGRSEDAALAAGAAAAKAIAAGHDLQTALAIGSASGASFDEYGAGSGGATAAGFLPYAVVIVDEAEEPMRMWAVDATKEVLEGGEPSEVMAAALNQAGQQRSAQPAGKVERPRDNGIEPAVELGSAHLPLSTRQPPAQGRRLLPCLPSRPP